MFFIAGLFMLVLMAAVFALLTGFVLMLIAPTLAEREPTYGESWKAMFIASVAQGLVAWVLAIVFISADEQSIMPALVATGAGFLVLTVVLAHQLEATLPRAALTAVVMSIIVTGLNVVIELLLGGSGSDVA